MKHSERWIGKRVEGRTLVVGGGDGALISLLEREGRRVVAVDPGQADELPFAPGNFDTVLLGDFLAKRVGYAQPIAEALRVLRPGGRLIISGPYGGDALETVEGDFELRELIDELAGCSIKDIARIGDRVLVDVRHRRGWNQGEAWRQALGIAELRMEGHLEEARRAGKEAEQARGELGVASEQLAEQEEKQRALTERVAARERELEELRGRLAKREGELERAKERLREVDRLRADAGRRERELALAEQRLEAARRRAEHFRASLVALREGRVYRLSKLLWRLRRPFSRSALGAEEADELADEPPPREEQAEAGTARAAPARPARERRPGAPLVVASILDEMSEACFAPECDLRPLRFEDWREQLDERQPDLLLVESAWNGNGGEWQYRIAKYPRPDLRGLPALRELLDECRERGIPTAFWNKEDPVHFERFAEAASLFDHVFTTDSRCVERYEELPGDFTVEPLPFAAQPRIHNPIAAVPERSASPCFAGAWYRDRHPDRRRALEALLDAARPFGLVIYDRTFGAESKEFGFPERFAPHVLGRLPYERVLDVYRSHSVFLNANSVVDSPTMCSRRVFELAACDTAILSTPGAALANLLGEGAVMECGEGEGAAEQLEHLLGDEPSRRARVRATRRKVFAEHTYARRLATIAGAAGLDGPPPVENGWELLAREGVALAPGALSDLKAAASFAVGDVIGVDAACVGGTPTEHRRVERLDPRAVLVRRDLCNGARPADLAGNLEAALERWSSQGASFYAADADLLDPPAREPTS